MLSPSPATSDSVADLVAAAAEAERAGDVARATALLDRAASATDDAGVLASIGQAFVRLQRPVRAIAALDRALAIWPSNAGLHLLRGRASNQLGRTDAALASFRRAVEIDPGRAEAWRILGSHCANAKLIPQAVAALERALALGGDHVDTLSNFGWALTQLQRFDEALAQLDRALALQPDYTAARWNRGLCLLAMGRFAEGLEDYEARLSLDDSRFERLRACDAPLWHKGEALAGRRLLLYNDQGHGDTIQFIRFARELARAGAEVIAEVQPELAELCATVHPRVRIIAQRETPPPFDLICPMASLPHRLGLTVETIPAAVPYLTPDPARVAAWRARLARLSGTVRVGLSWAGNVRHDNDTLRSIALARLSPLFAIEGLSFVSLQKIARDGDDAILARAGVLDPTRELNDFSDTAALIANLHLVISVDTSVAHLTGALGQPVWILTPFAADFRWLAGREDSPWYPSARLLRQPRFGDWDSVIARLGNELGNLARQPQGR